MMSQMYIKTWKWQDVSDLFLSFYQTHLSAVKVLKTETIGEACN